MTDKAATRKKLVPAAADFPETSWTLLAKARQPHEEGAKAREVLASRYYQPVREFLMVIVQDAEKAQDLSQEFFTKLSAPGGLLERATPEKGRFHDFLKAALRNLAIDHYRRIRRETRETYPDQTIGEGWDRLELAEFPAAEAVFHKEWVKVTLGEALSRVRDRCLRKEQNIHLALFEKRYLSDSEVAPSWDELGAPYGINEKAARERADTVVRHFRLVLRRMLRNEIAAASGARVTETQIDQEIKALLSPLKD